MRGRIEMLRAFHDAKMSDAKRSCQALKASARAAPRCRCSMPCCGAARRSKRRGAIGRDLSPADRALALAIAGEALRRLPDLDALIDSATRQRLPDDSKARMVLRLALAQKIGLGTPDHALVATALPLVDGGPRRLVHGVLGTLLRRGVPQIDAPHLPAEVEQRWREAWGDERRRGGAPADRQAPAARPDLRRRCRGAGLCREHGGISLAPRHVRLESASVADLPGFGEGRWWVQDLAASLPARLIPAGAADGARPLRRAGRQDHAARCGRAPGHRGRCLGKVVSHDCARISSERISKPCWSKRTR